MSGSGNSPRRRLRSRTEEYLIAVARGHQRGMCPPHLGTLAEQLQRGTEPALAGIQLLRVIAGTDGAPETLVVRMDASRAEQFKQEHPELTVELNHPLQLSPPFLL